MTHDIKCTREHFKEIRAGRKTFELRVNDRNYAPGDILLIREYDGTKATGEVEERYVPHMIDGGHFEHGEVLSPRWCIMSLQMIEEPELGAVGNFSETPPQAI